MASTNHKSVVLLNHLQFSFMCISGYICEQFAFLPNMISSTVSMLPRNEMSLDKGLSNELRPFFGNIRLRILSAPFEIKSHVAQLCFTTCKQWDYKLQKGIMLFFGRSPPCCWVKNTFARSYEVLCECTTTR